MASNAAPPSESERLIGAAEEFIEDVFGALEFEFIKHFGQRWTPEVNSLFQESQRTCRATAQAMDERAADAESFIPTNVNVRLLSNYKSTRG